MTSHTYAVYNMVDMHYRRSRLLKNYVKGYKKRQFKQKALKDFLYFLFCGLVFTGLLHSVTPYVLQVNDTFHNIVSALTPVSEASNESVIATPLPYTMIFPTVTPTPLPDQKPDTDTIDGYIQEVFGNDADKAFTLLQCENSSHNPDTVNTAGNYPEGSRDIGVFQINEYWQDVNPKYLFNWRINVLIAKQLYDENNHTFVMWTCGRRLGI